MDPRRMAHEQYERYCSEQKRENSASLSKYHIEDSTSNEDE